MYKDRNKDLTKLTIRVNNDDLERFKLFCEIKGVSANNQINMFIREFNFVNRPLYDNFLCLESDTKKSDF